MWSSRLFVAGTAIFAVACLPLVARSLRTGFRSGLFAPESFGSLAALLGSNALLLIALAPGGASGAIGLILLKAALVLALAFARSVFRPTDFAGTLLLVAGGLASAASLALDLAALGDSGVPRTSTAFRVGQVVCAIPLAWLAVETFAQRRRLALGLPLGLADPIVVNRFALLCAATGSLTLACFVTLGESFAHGALFEASRAVRGLLSTIAGAGVWLAFAPPRRYLAWVAARAKL